MAGLIEKNQKEIVPLTELNFYHVKNSKSLGGLLGNAIAF